MDEAKDDEVFYDALEPPDSPSIPQVDYQPRRSTRERKNVTRLAFACAAALAATPFASTIIDSGRYVNPLTHITTDHALPDLSAPKYILEEELLPSLSLQSKANEYMKQHLQLVDELDDAKNDDWSFIPESILEHRMPFKPMNKLFHLLS